MYRTDPMAATLSSLTEGFASTAEPFSSDEKSSSIPPWSSFAAADTASSSSAPSSPLSSSPALLSTVSSLPSFSPSDRPDRSLANIMRMRILQARKNWRVTAATVAAVVLMALSVRTRDDDPYEQYWGTEVGGGDEGVWGDGNPYSAASLSLPGMKVGLEPGEGVKLGRALQNLADVGEPMVEGDLPFFFHVPRSGGSTMKDILGMCFKKVAASDVGARHGHKYDKKLEVLTSEDGSHFVNVDTTTAEGIYRAKNLGLVESHMADVIITQLVHAGATMFNENQRGRMFTIMRHPIERAVSLFHYLSVADWEPTYDPDLAFISIEMWARSKRIEHNWMVRFLSNELERDLTPKHLEVAKEVLRQKCLIGLLTEKGDTMMRLERYFGWKYPSREEKDCQERLLHWGWSNKHTHPIVEEGSPAWQLLYKKNELDMQLYEYSKQLFVEQAELFRLGGAYGPETLEEEVATGEVPPPAEGAEP